MSNPEDPDNRPADESADAGTAAEGGGGSARPAAGSDEGQATVQLTPEEIAALDQSYESDPDDPLVGTLLRNKWRVLSRIGSGSFGTVYKVQDVNAGWIEALKILSDDRLRGPDAEAMRRRFLREAQIMKRLGSLSPHIVGLATYEDDAEAGLIYFLMEHVEGGVLSEVLLEEGPLSFQRAVRISLQVCDALTAAHESEEPVIHRDLKLENLMLTKGREGEESVKVLDFGIAKIVEREGDSRLTASGTLGTPGYAAPEQLRAGTIDGRTDLFAFGVILYSLVTGRNPWLGHLAYQPTNQTYELMSASDKGQVIPISETGVAVPPGLVEIIMKLLQPNPDRRFQSARELRDALLTLAGDGIRLGRSQTTRELHPPVGSSEPERRLAAVWFADLVGYSTLSSQDEEAALALLDTFHKSARRVIESGGGRVVQFIGDAVFAEFSSTQRAVVTARDFLEVFKNEASTATHEALLRIGVHVGDVLMAADGDVFGDGVNVAARIQNEAEPGQILVSQDVWRQLRQRRDFGFLPIGERSLKGIGAPVSLYAVVEAGDVTTTGDLVTGVDPSTGLPTYDGTDEPSRAWGRSRIAAAVVVVLLALGGGAYAAMNLGDDGSAPIEAAGPALGTDTGTPPEDVEDDDPRVADQDGGAVEQPTEQIPTSTPTEADPPVQTADDAAAPNGPEPSVDPTPPADEPPPERAPYLQLRSSVERERSEATAAAGAHAALSTRLGEGEARWSSAEESAAADEYDQAMDDLGAAERIYQEVVAAGDTLILIEQEQREIARLRGGATNASVVAQADNLERDANTAIREGRYGYAYERLARAKTFLESAGNIPSAPTTAEPELAPADVVAEVLARLEAAIEARDIAQVRNVWTNMTSEQTNGLSATFNAYRQVGVDYDIQSIDPEGDRILATVRETFTIQGFENSQTQVFTMERRAGTWLIVASRVAG